MNDRDADIATIVKRYVQAEEATVQRIAHEVAALPQLSDTQRNAARDKILETLELHAQADICAEEAVARYRENLYFVARQLAEDAGEFGIVTKAHVMQAQAILARPRRRYVWGDALLGFGGLLAGAAIPHLIELYRVPATSASPSLLLVGLVGALLFGMGIVAKIVR